MVWLILELVPAAQTLSQISGLALPSCSTLCLPCAADIPWVMEQWHSWAADSSNPSSFAPLQPPPGYSSQICWRPLEFWCIFFLSFSPSTSTCALFLDLRCVLWAPFISSLFLLIIPLMFLPNIKWSMVLARGSEGESSLNFLPNSWPGKIC